MGREQSGTAPITIGGRGRDYLVMIPMFSAVFIAVTLDWLGLLTGRLTWGRALLHASNHPVLFILLCIPLLAAANSPSYVKIFEDRLEMKALFAWSTVETHFYREIVRFENHHETAGRSSYWQVFMFLRNGERRALPRLGAGLFQKLKAALTDWQLQHGGLEPLPLAGISGDVLT